MPDEMCTLGGRPPGRAAAASGPRVYSARAQGPWPECPSSAHYSHPTSEHHLLPPSSGSDRSTSTTTISTSHKMRAFALASTLAAVVCSASPTQHPLSTPPSTQSLALVDLLSQSPDHSELLQLFRKARLIPMLNRINGTIFAPTNQAIKRVRERDSSSIWSVSDTDLTTTPANDYNSDDGLTWKPTQPHDNLQLALRDSLLQHCLNYTLIPAPGSHINSTNTKNLTTQPPFLPINKVTLQETLYFPNDDPFTGRPNRPELPGSPGDNTDPDAPHGKEGLLRGEGQKVRVIRKASKGVKGSDVDASQVWVGGDWKGEGGIKVVAAPVWAKNGVLLSVDDVLEKPKTLGEILDGWM